MFAGIIQAKSSILSIREGGECRVVRIKMPRGWKLVLGQSVAVDGICSTVARISPQWFEVVYMPETLAKTTMACLEKGSVVNLERSLRANALVDGHFVQGHVDGIARVLEITQRGDSRECSIEVSSELMRFIAERGSVTLNGVSLTIARRAQNHFTIALIPHTLAHTNLGEVHKGSLLNIETDMLARYLDTLAHSSHV